ncbi:MAG: glycosyltransferase family 39 protein [Gemmatimonadales bacterium]|nr:glycosyltransferase family 39 protein [Gemmatimonadales bacterium]
MTLSSASLRLLAAMIGIGASLRLVLYLTNNSVIMDEARVAVNVLSRSYLDLLPPLDHDQSAPIMFLWSVKALTDLFGPGEFALRAVALASGIGTLLLSYPALRHPIGPPAAAIATSLLAMSPGLVQYSATAKQYGLEAFVTLVLIKLTFDVLRAPTSGSIRWLLLGGMVAPWASAPAGFVLVSIVGALGLRWSGPGGWGYKVALKAAALWGCSYLLAYGLVYRYASQNPYMQRFWEPAFLTPENPDAASQFFRVMRGLLWGGLPEEIHATSGDIIRDTLVLFTTIGLATYASVGFARLRQAGGPSAAVAVVGPILLAAGASIAGFYPFSRRLMLFALPLLALLVGAGIAAAFSYSRSSRQRTAHGIVVALVLFPPFLTACLTGIAKRASARTLISASHPERRGGEPIYISPASIPEWTYYTTDWNNPDRPRLALLNRVARPGGPSFENAPSRDSVPMGTGVDLIWPSSTGDEILGLATGIELRAGEGNPETRTDRGWLTNESARIQAAAAPGVWVLLKTPYGPEIELLDAVERAGGHQTHSLVLRGIVLARYEFP